MKKYMRVFSLIMALTIGLSVPVFAKTGERGVFGGISQGISLPKTTEQLLAATTTTRRTASTQNYSEMIFLSGTPERFDGILTINSGVVDPKKDTGTYNVDYFVEPDPETLVEGAPIINRDVTLRVNYRKVKDSGSDQLILDYNVVDWAETITVGGTTFSLVPAKSYFGRSIIEDITPGVSYYKGQTSSVSHYVASGVPTVVETSGTVYGYDCPWSKTETERLNVTVLSGTEGTEGSWQLEAQIRPSVSVNKVIQYSPNEPTAISFDGNYYEVTKNTSALAYNVFTIPKQFERGYVSSGSVSIPNTNKFEMLPAPDLAFLKGHFAEDDIKKLFAMQIYDGVPTQFQPAQAMTRAQFVKGLVQAFKIPIEPPASTSKNKKAPIVVLFPDVTSDRPDFAYLMAAYNSGIVYGRYNASVDNNFRPDDAITMEEAVVMLVRGLGLENLGLTPTTVTVFADDANISAWSKREISAAHKIGIIDMDVNGNINARKKLTKAEGSAIINSTIDYMRTGLPVDYVEHILNFAD